METPKNKSVSKMLSILDCFTPSYPERGITELAELLDLKKSNVHSLVSTLVQHGMLEKNEQTGKYTLGLKLLTYSHTIISCMAARKIMIPYLIKLCQICGENVTLCMPNGTNVLYLDTLSPTVSYVQELVVGRSTPMYCTGVGKALLAFSDDSLVETVLSQRLIMFTENTIVDPVALRKELEITRKRGYGFASGEWHSGRASLGMPVFDRQHKLIAGISISGQAQQFGEDRCAFFSDNLRDTISSIESIIGYGSPYHFG